MADMVHCRGCGELIHSTALTCPHCGATQGTKGASAPKSRIIAIVLCLFLGTLGVHRFYLNQNGLGLTYLLTTLLTCGIGAFLLVFVNLVECVLLAVMSDQEFASKYG